MTSSQALLTNLIGPLSARSDWLLHVLAGLLERRDFRNLLRCDIEFAPPARNQYLGDMTRVDAYIVVETSVGPEAVVLELKYTDRFSSRRLPLADNVRYQALARSSGAWATSDAAFADGETSQLLRCHALAMRAMQVEYGVLPATLLLISHPLDPGPELTLARYQRHLVRPETAVHQTLDTLLDLAAAHAITKDEQNAAVELAVRYLRHDLSEALWDEHVALATGHAPGRV